MVLFGLFIGNIGEIEEKMKRKGSNLHFRYNKTE